MRRQDRHIMSGILIVGGVTALSDIFLQWVEHTNREIDFTWENYNGWRTIRRAAIGGICGAGIGYAVYRYKINEERKLPFDSDEYLKEVLSGEHLKADSAAFKRIVDYREKMKKWLADKFNNKLAALPEDTGSFYKRTAISSNYDLDIVLPFKKNSYTSLEEMYDDVYREVSGAFSSKANVTKQTKAIGVTFENNEKPIHFDIVPGREINNYATQKDLNLYMKPDWVWQKSSSFKTNIGIQKRLTVNKPEARAIIKLLKAYRNRNSLPIPTLVIDQCVVGALSENNFGIHPSLTENLLNSMDFVSKKMKQKCLIDTANTNNNLYNKLSETQRNRVSYQLQVDVKRININPREIKEIFEL